MSYRFPIDPILPELSWEEVLSWAGLDYRRRSKSGSLQTLCVFHDERSPSLFFYPRGIYICYGCTASGSKLDFISFLMAGETPGSDFLGEPPRVYLAGGETRVSSAGQLELDFRKRKSWTRS